MDIDAAFSTDSSRRPSLLSTDAEVESLSSVRSRDTASGSFSSDVSTTTDDIDLSQKDRRSPFRNFLTRRGSVNKRHAKGAEFGTSVIWDGWLIKCGGSVKTWKKRWFVLTPTHLCYYKEKGESLPTGAIPLSTYRCRDAPEVPKPNAFMLSSETLRTYVITANSEEEKTQWIDVITRAITNEQSNTCSGKVPLPETFDYSNITVSTPDFPPPTPIMSNQPDITGEDILKDLNIPVAPPPPPPSTPQKAERSTTMTCPKLTVN